MDAVAIVAAGSRSGPDQTAQVASVLTRAMTALRFPRPVVTSARWIMATSRAR